MRIRRFQTGDETALSTIVCRCLREINSVDYPSEVLEALAKSFTPDKIALFAKGREVFVAESGTTVVGTASLARDDRVKEEKYVCLTVFVLPEYHSSGIGKALMMRVEGAARKKDAASLEVPSSITALPFYTKLGYTPVSGLTPNAGEHWIWLTKPL